MVVLKSRRENTNRGISLRETISQTKFITSRKTMWLEGSWKFDLMTRTIRTVAMALKVTRTDCLPKPNTGKKVV